MQSQQQKGRPQLVVYFAHCPEHGPEHRVYDEEDIHGAGGIHAIEAEMQRETYWYDPQWATRVLTQDVILDEFPLTVPVQLRWGSGEKAVVAEVLPISHC